MLGCWNLQSCIAVSISVSFNPPSLLVSSRRSDTLRFSYNLSLSAGSQTSSLNLKSRDKDLSISLSSSRRSSGSGGSKVPWCSGGSLVPDLVSWVPYRCFRIYTYILHSYLTKPIYLLFFYFYDIKAASLWFNGTSDTVFCEVNVN